MSASGYVKSHRSIFDHWVADDPKTFMAWQEITHSAAYAEYTIEVCGQVIKLERGQVNISNLESRKHFTDKQWRSFLERLIECQMIARSTVRHLGRGNGSIAVYDVVSYDKYQSNSEGMSNGMSKGSAKGSPKERMGRVEPQVEGNPNGMSNGMSKGASYIKEFKEVQELPPLEPTDPETEKAYSEVAYAVGHPTAEWLRDKRDFDFVRAFKDWGDQLEDLWKAAVHHGSRKPGDKAKFRFQDACEGDLDLGVKPPQRQSEIRSAARAAPDLEPGQLVQVPDGSVHEVASAMPAWVSFVDDYQAVRPWECLPVAGHERGVVN
jgi:hypothetical protein